MSGQRYTEEFKIEAVKQVTDRGHSVADVADRLGVTNHSGFQSSFRRMGHQPNFFAPCFNTLSYDILNEWLIIQL